MVYQATVLSTLLCSCETWSLYRYQINQLERFHQSKLRSILNAKWDDHVTNNEVLTRANSMRIQTMIEKQQRRWLGHIKGMPETRIPKQMLYSELEEGHRPRGAPKKRFCDSIKKSMTLFNIQPDNWESMAEERNNWK